MRGAGLGDSDDEYESSLEPTSGFYGKRIKAKASSGNSSTRKGNESVSLSSHQSRSIHTSDVSVSTPRSPIAEQIAHCKAVAKRVCVFMLTNVFMSITLLIIGIGLSLGPGLHSLLVVDPAPTIDKSLNAFNIPNHIVSRRQDALQVAKNPPKRRRTRRDLDSEFEHPSSESLPDSTQVYIPSYFELLGRDIVEPMKSYFLKGNEPLIDIMDMSSKEPRHRRIRRSVLKEHIKRNVMYAYADDPAEEEGEWIGDIHLNRGKRNADKIRGLTQAFRTWKMQVVYLAVSGSEPNVFTKENIEHINHVETMIKEQKGFTDFCYISYSKWSEDRNLDRYQGCAPINSLMTYFYPSLYNGKIQYDGLGKIQEPIDRTLSFAMTKDTFFWYVDDKINNTYRKSKLLRSEVQFGSPLAGNVSRIVCEPVCLYQEIIPYCFRNIHLVKAWLCIMIQSLSQCPSKFKFLLVVKGTLTGRLTSRTILASHRWHNVKL